MSAVTAETFAAAADGDATALKACCAAVYGQEWLALLVGESLHPGGLALTRHLGRRLRLGPADRVLDIACGTGTTSVFLAQEFGCHVTGVDYGATQIERATAAAAAAGVADRTAFEVGDAESLPFDDSSFTAVICECAFCTFPSKARAAGEMYRVLAPGGRVGITDLTVNGLLPEALQGVAAWVACVVDAQPVDQKIRALAIDSPRKTTISAIVNLKSCNSRPRRVLNELSAAPNRPVPCPLTWSNMITTRRIETSIWMMLRTVISG